MGCHNVCMTFDMNKYINNIIYLVNTFVLLYKYLFSQKTEILNRT